MQPSAAELQTISSGTADANRRFEERFNAGEVEAAARGVYTANARVLPPGAPAVQGRDSIVEFWKAAATALGIAEVKLTTLELQGAGDTAYEVGRADLRVGGGAQEATGKYVVIWKQEDGQWRWDVDIWNMDA